ncbi:hypothetical protein [Hymenobacter algoricola]|uniref:Type IX secretion system membrane protein PorP/SprF n=1 Tax=Hymenobacter algoricola TaxID=486267 RepID=A0ABP7MM91_9BACT
MWLGIREKLFLQVDANPGMLGVGNYTVRTALGSGLGQLYGSSVLVGAAFARHFPSYGMGFLGADIQVGHTGLSLYPYAATDFGRHHQLNLRVGYRIPLGRK